MCRRSANGASCSPGRASVRATRAVARTDCAFWQRSNVPELFRFPERHAAGRRRAEPAERPGPGPLLRARVEGHRTVRELPDILSGKDLQHGPPSIPPQHTRLSTALAFPRPALPLDNPPPIKITGRQVPSPAVSGANSAQAQRHDRERRRTARHDAIGDSDRCRDRRPQHPGRRQRNHHRSTAAADRGHEPVPHRGDLGPHVPLQPQTGRQRACTFRRWARWTSPSGTSSARR